jgi:PAS domain S-box-containing protein
VEDEGIVAMDLRRALEGFGYEVPAMAISGSEALEMARDTRPDIVLMDIQLDGQMDGIDVAHRLKGSLDVPVVFLTAYGNETTLQRAKTAQPFGFLLKPFQERELRSAVEVALYKHGMEKKLRQRESWLDAILRGMADCVIATDAAGFITFMNPPAERLTGQTLDQVRELTLAKMLHLVDDGRAPISLDTVLDGAGVHGTASATLVSPDQRETPVDLSVTRLQNNEGRPEGTVVVFRDVSLRLKAEQAEAFRRSEERLQALIDGGSDMIIVCDSEMKIRYASPSVERIVGYSPAESLDTSILDYLIPEDHETLLAATEAVRQGYHERVTREYRVRHRDGSLVILETVSTDLLDDPLINGIVLNARDVTERKRMEVTLRQSERDYRGLFENANDCIVIFEPVEEVVLEANARACEVYRVDHSDFIGMSLEDFSDDVTRGREHIALTLATDSAHRFETVQRRKDGSVLNLEITATEVNYQGTRAIYSIGRDVTERKRSEQAIVRANRRLEILNILWREIAAVRSPHEVVEAALTKLIELLPCDFGSVVLTGRQSQDSTVFVAVGDEELGPMSGVSLPFEGDTECALTDDDGLKRCPDLGADGEPGCPMARKHFGEGAAECVCASLSAEGSGSGRLHLVSRSPESFSSDDLEVAREVAGVIGVALHQARLQAELEDHELRLRALVDNLPEGVACLDLDFRVTLANPPGRNLLRVIADAGLGDVVDQLAGRKMSEILVTTADDPQRSVTVESQDHRTFELGVVDLAGDRRGVSGYIIVIRELTRELETRKRLELSERLSSVGQLAAGIAHDFNNMLQAISGSAQLIEVDDQLPDPIREKARGISQQGQRGAGLIRQILDFSRTSVSERRPLRLELIIRETTKMLERFISEEVSIRTEIEPGEHVVVADPTQVQQVLMNLAVNGRDAMPGGGELTISLDRTHFATEAPRPFPQMAPGEWLRLTVRDNGSGMPPDVMSRVFEPFFTTKEPDVGTGLGLAQVYGIVKQHEGFIDLESELGDGTSFTVYLPLATSETRDEIAAERAPEKVGGGELLLLVEDETPVRHVIQEMLENLGFEVVTAASGSEALQVFERFQSDIELVISDVVLSGISGLEVLKSVQEINPGLPVILMSGYPLEDDARCELSAGMTDWLSKPFSSEQLGKIIERVLSPN